MGNIKFTESQRKAIEFDDRNLLLSAAAGSGKTACLTERIVELVKKGKADIDEMLIVTFTRAATSEMKERISKRLREEADSVKHSDKETYSRLQRSSRKVAIAEISTIHAFLYKNLKPYFPVLGIPVESRILDEQQMKILKKREIKRIVESKFNENAEKDREFIDLIDLIGITRDTDKIEEELYWIFENITFDRSFGNKYINSFISNESNPYSDHLRKKILDFSDFYKRVFEDFDSIFGENPVVKEKYGSAIESDLNWIKEVEEELSSSDFNYSSLCNVFSEYIAVQLGKLSSKYSDEACSKYKHFRDLFKKDIEKIKKNFFIYSSDEIRSSGEKVQEKIKYINKLADEYQKRLFRAKTDLAGMEYDDLEKYAIKLLVDEDGKSTEIAREIGGKYKYIFVDEYQDTNGIQDKIFKAISGDAVRFLVGDIKQSIYRFRGADPGVFLKYREMWNGDRLNKYSKDGESIFLSENFRCDKAIIDFTNAVSRVTLANGSVDYRAEDDLVCGKDPDGNKKTVPVEVIMIDAAKEKEAEAESFEDDGRDPEAAMVAKIIQNTIGRYSPDLDKIITPSDIAILMRSPGASSWKYAKELRALGISVDSGKSNSMEDYSSIRLLVCMLNFIDNPLREIYAIGVMRSHIFNFSVDEIKLLRGISDESIYLLINRIIGNDQIQVPSDLYEKCAAVAAWRERYKILSSGVNVSDFLEYLVGNCEINKINEINNDPRETDAVNRLLEISREFENECAIKSRIGNISEFLEYLERTFVDGDEEFSGVGEKNTNSVSILSIHASKGLEFPICILAETGKRRNMSDETRTILYDADFGFGMMLPDSSGLARYDNIFRRIISSKMANDSIEEEMRMLYVALTRAKNKLIITGKTRNAEKLLEKTEDENEYLNEYLIKNKTTYLEWIAAACFRNKNGEISRLKIIKEDDILNENSDYSSPLVGGDDISSAGDDPEQKNKIQSRLNSFCYDNYLENVPSKLTASELSEGAIDNLSGEHAAENENTTGQLLKKPDFMLGKRSVSGAEIGTAFHTFLQFVDFSNLNKLGFESEKNRLIEQKYMKRDQADLINKSQINRLLESAFLDKIVRSDFVKREFRFNVNLDASRFTRNEELKRKFIENGTEITIQGVVDCVFRDPDSGNLVLVDYKTDAILPHEWKNIESAVQRLRDRHKNQLKYYTEICSEMFEETIAETYIYSTALGRQISIEK